MRVTKYLTLLSLAAVCTSAHADWIAKQAPMCDLTKANTTAFATHNASVVSIATPTSGAVATVKFSSYQASFGQDFAAAQNWSAYNIVDMVLTNKSSVNENFKFITQLYQDPSNYTNAFDGSFTVYANGTRHFVCYLNQDNPLPYGMKYLNPVLSADAWESTDGSTVRNLSAVWHWRLSYQGSTACQVDISNMRLIRQSLNFTGIADAYGQYTDKTWPGKVTQNSDLAADANAEWADNGSHPGTGETLGTTKITNPSPTLGKWAVVTLSSGQKFLQHPNGRLFWSLGLNAVLDSLPTPIQNRTAYFKSLPSTTGFFAPCYCTLNTPAGSQTCYSFRKQNLMMKYGSSYMPTWTKMINSRMGSWGFNTFGIDCNTALYNASVPFTADLSTGGYGTRLKVPYTKWGSLPDPYGTGFLSWCQSNFKSGLAPYLASQNFMGTFVDNEMSWGNMDDNPHRYNVALGAFTAPSTQPAKIAFINQLTAKYGTIQALDTSWGGTGWTSFTSLLQNTTWTPKYYTPGLVNDLQTFVTSFATKYYTTVRSALGTAGLKSFYLGSRFADYTDEVVNAASNSVDILSFNVYRYAYDVPFSYYNTLKKPVMISEFGFTMRAMGTFGGPASMPGSPGRAFRISEFLNLAIKQPNVIGAHYYCYADQPITGRYSDYENGGFGMVDVTDLPYPDSVNALRTFTSNMYNVRAGSTSSGGGGGGA